MVYETKLPRQASSSTVAEDFSEDSEVGSNTKVEQLRTREVRLLYFYICIYYGGG